jgi:hypothetical protein
MKNDRCLRCRLCSQAIRAGARPCCDQFKIFGLVVAPVDPEGRVTLVGQYRYVLGRYTRELHGGFGPTGVDPLHTAWCLIPVFRGAGFA